MNECPACNSQLIKESVGGGNVRTYCRRCGYSEVVDNKGRQLLIGEHRSSRSEARSKPGNLLLEG